METRVFEDVNPPAFFEAFKKNFQILPRKNSQTGRVEFLVIGEGIDGALQDLKANTPVGVHDFIEELKSLCSSNFAHKGGQR